jgi:hypothetical protein
MYKLFDVHPKFSVLEKWVMVKLLCPPSAAFSLLYSLCHIRATNICTVQNRISTLNNLWKTSDLFVTVWLSPTFHSKCRVDKGLIKRGSRIDYWRSQCKGRIIMARPLCIHSFNHLVPNSVDLEKGLSLLFPYVQESNVHETSPPNQLELEIFQHECLMIAESLSVYEI